MKLRNLLPVLMVAACSSGPTKQESVQIFAAANAAMTSAQSRAVTDAQNNTVAAPAELLLDFTGPCTLGGAISVKGTYDGDGSDEATFDLQTSFNGCKEIQGSLDGGIHWTSTSSSTGFSASMTGDLEWDGNDGSASCAFDLHMAISQASISYSGSICGYDVTSELTLQPGS